MKYEGIDDCLMHKGAVAKGQQLGRQLTCCGTECAECGFYGNACAGCNALSSLKFKKHRKDMAKHTKQP